MNKKVNRKRKNNVKINKTLRYSLSNCKSFVWGIFHTVYGWQAYNTYN